MSNEKIIKVPLNIKFQDLDELIYFVGDKHEQKVERLISTAIINKFNIYILIEDQNEKTENFKNEIKKEITGILKPVFVYQEFPK